MKASLITGFIGGCLGAIILVIIMYILMGAGMGDPAFVEMYHGIAGVHSAIADNIIAGILFIISGGIWGLIFTGLVKKPNSLKRDVIRVHTFTLDLDSSGSFYGSTFVQWFRGERYYYAHYF